MAKSVPFYKNFKKFIYLKYFYKFHKNLQKRSHLNNEDWRGVGEDFSGEVTQGQGLARAFPAIADSDSAL
jgi:hypothetical protein